MVFIVGQAVGFLAMLTSMVSNMQTKRRRVIAYRLITDVLWVINCCMIRSYPAALSSTFAITREAVFFNKGKKWANSKWWIIFYAGVFTCSAIITWKDIFSVIPAIASTLATIAFWCTNVYTMKTIIAIYSSLMLVYNIRYYSIAGALDAILAIAAVLVSLYVMKFGKSKKIRKEKNYANK